MAPGTAATGVASRLAGEAGSSGESLKQPSNEVASRLLGTMSGLDTNGRPIWVNLDRLKFASGSSTLPADANPQLDQIAAILKAHPDLHLKVAGFTDNVESAPDNLRLSQLRAESVKSALVARAIAPDRIAAQGFGDQDALADNTTMAGRAANRRVSVRVSDPTLKRYRHPGFTRPGAAHDMR
jgi:outer membrane protein OmpA-like peptidoglycan-associated protein